MPKSLRQIVENKKKWPDHFVKKETKRSQDEISKQVKKSGKDDLKRKKKVGLFPYNEETDPKSRKEAQDIADFVKKNFQGKSFGGFKVTGQLTDKHIEQGARIRARINNSYPYPGLKDFDDEQLEKREKERKNVKKEETDLNEDTISLTVPLFIRMLEYAKEDAKTDMDLHKATERILELSDGDDTLDMDSYDEIIEEETLDEANQAAKAKLALSNKRMKGSMRPQIKRAGDLAREKRERNAAMRGAKREMKDTGEKVKFQKFKRWDSVKKSAREKMED
jgi:hypothetical protein